MKCPECRRRMTKVDKKGYYCNSCRLGSYEIEPPPAASVLRLRPCPYCGAPAEMYVRDEPRGYMVCCTGRDCAHDYETQVFMANCKSKGKRCPGYRIYISIVVWAKSSGNGTRTAGGPNFVKNQKKILRTGTRAGHGGDWNDSVETQTGV